MEAEVIDEAAASHTTGEICPFSDAAPNEDYYSEELWPELPRNDGIGRYRSVWAGHVTEDTFRKEGSSGGVTTWLLAEAMRKGLIDAVVHVHHSQRSEEIFEYQVSHTVSEIRAGAKTRYYSLSYEKALEACLAAHQAIAVVGVPCVIKSIRNLCERDPKLKANVKYLFSLFCGHMKSAQFGESLAWQLGVVRKDIDALDFRLKLPNRKAIDYGFAVTNRLGETISTPMGELVGRRWDGGYHRLKACDFCDDVVGETADVSCGDAWLPEYSQDFRGTNVVIARNRELSEMLEQASETGRLKLDVLQVERAVRSQAGGLRDRRDGLAYRLWLDKKRGLFRPKKRVEPSRKHLGILRKINFRLRRIVRVRSIRSYAFTRRVGSILPYSLEMRFWHNLFVLFTKFEGMISRSYKH